ncbi:hypothetical protein NQ314_010458 [Rhamnusium bicolor]|uniref:Uncharacterized protein n=1 Tax=Rhamnusium bicolor TaxID=1586634 RepID=A0AAV8XSB4_9CUCU|nr:hypothetical protein NQ314_010458 [Rhamnusium bicolor]
MDGNECNGHCEGNLKSWENVKWFTHWFSVGDELGFKESLSNTEQNRRRSAQASKLQAQLIQAQQNAKKISQISVADSISYECWVIQLFNGRKLTTDTHSNVGNSITVRSPSPVASIEAVPVPYMQVVTPLAAGAVKTAMKKSSASSSSPVVPPFKPIPPADERPTINYKTSSSSVSRPSMMGIVIPSFSAMPSSISRFSVGNLPVSPSGAKVMAVVAIPKTKVQAQDKISSTNFAVRTLPTPDNELPAPIPQHFSNSIQAILAANNVTEEALELALLQRQQMLAKMKTSTSTTTTSTHRPTSKYANSVGKVMNAPKEYYPVGYDKNFDDNFASRGCMQTKILDAW